MYKLKKIFIIATISISASIILSGCNFSGFSNTEDKDELADSLIKEYEFEDLKVELNTDEFVNNFNKNSDITLHRFIPSESDKETDMFNKDFNITYEYKFNDKIKLILETSNDIILKSNLIFSGTTEDESYNDFKHISKSITQTIHNKDNTIIEDLHMDNPTNEGQLVYVDYGLYGVYKGDSEVNFMIHIKNIDNEKISLEDLQTDDKDTLVNYLNTYIKSHQSIKTATSNINKLIDEEKEGTIEDESKWLKGMIANSDFISNGVKELKAITPPDSLTDLHALSLEIYEDYNITADIYREEFEEKSSLEEVNKSRVKDGDTYQLDGKSKLTYLESEVLSIMNSLSQQ